MTATADTGQLPPVPTAPAAIPAPSPEPVSVAQAVTPVALVATTTQPDVMDRLRGSLQSMRSLRSRRLTAPGGVVLAALVLAPGVLLDLSPDGTFGTASTVTFIVAGVVAALAVRNRALITVAVLPPLLFVGAVAVLAQLSGNNEGSREVVLDVGTTLAVSAPVLYAGTAATLAVVLGRVAVGLVRR